MNKYLLLPLSLVFLLSGCAHVISEETLKTVDRDLTFKQVREKPEAYLGKILVTGGTIAETRNTKEGSELEIVQHILDRKGIPENAFYSDGRFLAITPDFLDPAIYKPGRMVTIAGEVKGTRVQPLDAADYTYPVLLIKEIHVWQSFAEEQGFPYPCPPKYYNYDPYFGGHEPGPQWYRPPGQIFKRY